MFRELRRKKQALSEAECLAILERNSSGVLAVAGDEGWPYAVPLNYALAEGRIFLHSAKEGHKLDAIRRCDRVSFCVVDQDLIVPEEVTSYFRSVIIFAHARILTTDQERLLALTCLAEKFAPDLPEIRRRSIEGSWNRVVLIELAPEHISGKEAIELREARP